MPTSIKRIITDIRKSVITVLSLLLFCAFAPCTYAGDLTLTNGQNVVPLSSSVILFKDNTGTPSPPQAFNYFKQNKRDAATADSITFEPGVATYWLQFSVTNSSESESWVLTPGSAFTGKSLIFKHLSVYEGDNTIPVAIISANSEEERRSMTDGTDVTLTIPQGITRTITVRIDTVKSVPLTITPELVERGAYNNRISQQKLFTGSVIVIGIAFAAVALSLLFMSGIPSLLYFCFYIPSLILFMISREGTLHWFAPFIPVALYETLYTVSYFAVPFFALLITRHFLDLPDNSPKTVDPVIVLVAALTPIIPIALLMQDALPPAVYYLYDFLPQCFFAGCIILGIAFAFLKNLPHSFWISWAVLFGGYSALLIEKKGLAANLPVIPSYIFVVCVVLHILLLGAAYITKIKMMMQKQTDIEETQKLLHKRQTEEEAKRNALVRQYENKVKDQEKEYLQELRRQDAARKNELIAAKREAERANEAKSDFLAMISHEIRTPLTGILGMIQLTSQTSLTPQQREYIDTVQYSGETLLALLNDILDFSKIEKGKLELEIIGFNLEKLLKSVLMLMTGRAGEKGLALHLKMDEGLPSYVKGDPTRIRQILLNLINNAIKFTERGSVTIHVQKISDSGTHVELRFNVIDTGIGISPEAKARLFSAYSQADETISRKYGGTGLGLSICKKLISAMAGKIDIASTPGQGSTFWFVIPMEIAPESSVTGGDTAGKTADTASASSRPLRILCIDDNEINLKVLAGLLNKPGRTIVTEISPIKALDIVRSDNFDIILVDMNMPQMNGPEFAKAVRALPDAAKSAIPVVALTGNASQEDMAVCHRAGMNDFLVKPIMIEALNRTIDAVLDKKGRFDTRPVPPPPAPSSDNNKQPEPTIVPWIENTVPAPAAPTDAEYNVPVSGETPLSATEKKETNVITPLGSPDRNDRI